MDFTDETNTISATVEFKTAKGNPAIVDGVPVWEIEGATIGELTVSDDGLSASIALNHSLGEATLRMTADADLDEGEVRAITGAALIRIVPAEAATATINLAEVTA